MKWFLVRRVPTPMWVVQLYYYWKHRALISRRAEVDLSGSPAWGPGCVISAFTKVKIRAPLDGADIGDDALVSAGAVVGGQFAPRSIVQGNPAKLIFTRR